MAETQIIVDIQVEDKEVLAAEKSIDKLTDSIEELGNSIKDTRAQNKEYKKQQEELNKLYKAGKISSEQYEAGIDGINSKIKLNNKSIAENSVELSKQKQSRTANIKLLNSEANSRDQLRQRISILSKEYNSLNIETKEGRLESERLQLELKDLNEQLNKGSKAAGSFKDNIGNYPEVVDGASLSLSQLGDGLEQVPGATSSAVGGIKSLGTAFKALLANPVVLVIAAIVAGLSALFSAFKRSETGSKLLSQAMAGLRGIMAVLTKLADTIGKAFSSSMDEAGESTISFWEILKKNLVNRLKGVIDLVIALGDVISGALTLDLEKLKEAAGRAGTALIQMGTGFDGEEQKKFTELLKEAAKEADRITKIFLDLEKAQRGSRIEVRSLEKGIASLNAEFNELAEVAGDDTRNLQEMEQAAKDAREAAAKLADKQISLAKARLNLISQEVAARRSAGEDIQDILDDQAAAQVALIDAVSQSAIAEQKILMEQNKIKRDIFEQNLDILLDVGDKIKTEQEKQIQNENLSLAKRRMLLEASRAALAANFTEIKKEYELYGVTAEQINDVINASDAKQANEKLKALGLNEIANNRLREIILERKQAELDFNDLSKDLSDEEVERKQAANDKISKINEESAIRNKEDAIKSAKERNESTVKLEEELRDALIELEREKLEILLEDETLLEEERAALILESETIIDEIREEFSDKKDEREEASVNKRKQIISDQLNDIISITTQFAGKEAAIFANITKTIIDSFEKGKISAISAIGAIGMVSNSLFDVMSERRDNDLLENEALRTAELELAEGNEAAQAVINETYDKKSAALKLKQFKADKAKALIDIAIQTAIAVTKAVAIAPVTGGLPFSAIVAALGIAQGVVVASKKAPKFAKGTSNIVSIGDSHASGNDVDVWGYSGGQSQFFGKVEKGEAMPVIRKSAANDYKVSMLNGQFTPRNNRKFQDGTTDITSQVPQQNNDVFLSQLIGAFQDITIVTKVEDITKGVAKKVQIVENSKV